MQRDRRLSAANPLIPNPPAASVLVRPDTGGAPSRTAITTTDLNGSPVFASTTAPDTLPVAV